MAPFRLARIMIAFALVTACASPAPSAADAATREPRSPRVTDTARPKVAWVKLTRGQTVSGVLSASNRNCRVRATDDVRVHRVDFFLDGRRIARDARAPYACRWDTRTASSGTHTLSAMAVDGARRSAKASVTVVIAARRSKPKPKPKPQPTPSSGSQSRPAGSPQPPPASQPPSLAVTPITNRIYYVSSTGSDSQDGLSDATAWRTVKKVNSAALQAGDGVLFQGGSVFSDDALSPSRSGTAASRIVFGSYGGEKASLPQGVYLQSVRGLAFQNLAISGPQQGVLASGSGGGVPDVTLENLSISNVGIAINSANWGDTNWTIRNNTIRQTGDSGMILYGSNFTISANTISDTGTDSSIAYGKHGIYLKVIDAQVTYNTITRPGASGISVRYRNSVLEHNAISGGEEGIAWYQYDPVAGTSYWRYNTISNTTGAAIYVSPDDSAGPTRESFVISNNTLSKASGVYTNLHATSGTYSVFGNLQQ